MKSRLWMLMVITVLCLPMIGAKCNHVQVRPTVDGDSIGVVVIVDEGTAEKFDENVSKFETVLERTEKILSGVVVLAGTVDELSKDEDVSDAAKDVGENARRGVAGVGVLLALAGLIKNLVKKEG